MLDRLARAVARRRWWVLGACLVATTASAWMGSRLFGRLGYSVFYDPQAPSTRAKNLAHELFGEGDPDVVALYRLPEGVAAAAGFADPAVRAALERTLERVRRDPDVTGVLSALTVGGERFVSRDRRASFVVLSLRGDPGAKAKVVPRLQRLLPMELAAGGAHAVAPLLGGLVPSGRSLTRLARQSLALGERIALPIVAVLLLLIFGSVVAALLPLTIGGLSIVLTLGILDLLAPVITVDIFAINVVTILGLGVAIDYALFVVSRYREEVARTTSDEASGAVRRAALARSVETAGRAALFSGITVAASLGSLLVFPQPFLRSVAIGGMAVVLAASSLAVVVLPAMIAILGPRLERGRLRRPGRARPTSHAPARMWRRLAIVATRHPALFCGGVTLGLLTLAQPFVRLQPSRSDVRALPRAEEPRQVVEALARDFAAATLTPVALIVATDGDLIDEERLAQLYDYVERVRHTPGVDEVESIFTFARVHDRDAAAALEPTLARYAARTPRTGEPGLGMILHGRYTRLRVITRAPPDSPEAQRLVRALETLPPPPGGRVLLYGQAAALHDFAAGLHARAGWMLAVVAASMFVVLFFAFRTVVLPLKAMLMTALSLTASFGAIVFIFQDGRWQRFLGYEGVGTIDATLPVVMFAVVFGLSMDYEVFIIGRIREAWLRTGNNREAIVEGLTQTGRLVTGAAAIMMVVFSAFAAASVLFVKALGFGMALAVILDATVVRLLLVPSTMTLLGRLNWWAPSLAALRHVPRRSVHPASH
jgi:trehalose monomycolate/heme transporter